MADSNCIWASSPRLGDDRGAREPRYRMKVDRSERSMWEENTGTSSMPVFVRTN